MQKTEVYRLGRIRTIAALTVQAGLAVGVILICILCEMPALGVVVLGALIALAIGSSMPRINSRWTVAFESAMSWVCAAVAAAILSIKNFYWVGTSPELAIVVIAALAIVLIPVVHSSADSARRRNWKLQIIFWCLFAGSMLLGDGWWLRNSVMFFAGWAIIALVIIVSKLWFRPPPFVVLVENTAILLLIASPIVDSFVRPPIHTRLSAKPYYVCESVAHPGTIYQCWSPLISDEWARMQTIIIPRENHSGPQYKFKPNANYRFYHSDIHINNLGFRGRDVTVEKGNTFRIVAIGESTTFGITLNPGERPWPELLEEMIRTHLNLSRTVEVINAGFPGSTIEDSLSRLDEDILRLKPDMIISYHGINGFHLLDNAIPPLTDPNPPKYYERPLTLLANLEYRWDVRQFTKRRVAALERHPPAFADILNSNYASDIRRLIEVCKTNHIELVLGTFSLAVNRNSETEVIDFYHGIYAEVPWTIRANEAYSKLLGAIAHEESDIHLVNTQPGLDGQYTNFTDLMHLTQPGRQKIAEAFFSGIREVLTTKVSNSP